MAKTTTLESHFYFSKFFVRVLLYNANIARINVNKNTDFCLHFG